MPARHATSHRACTVAALAGLAALAPLTGCDGSTGPTRGVPGITVVSGAAGPDTVYAELTDPRVVEVRGSTGRPVVGTAVTFHGMEIFLDGSSRRTDTTDTAGRVTTSEKLGRVPGVADAGGYLAWAPDGRRIAYSTTYENRLAVIRVPEGGTPTYVTPRPTSSNPPGGRPRSWGPALGGVSRRSG